MRNSLIAGFAILAAAAPAHAQVRHVRAGEDLQAALNAAKPGDELRLDAGATFTGNFVLPVKTGELPVTVRTDLPDADAPAANERISPRTAVRFAKIVSPSSEAALRTAPAARHWRILLLEFPPNKEGYGDIIQLGDGSAAQNDLSLVPSDITLDRVYVHGDPLYGQKRGIALNARAVTIANCYVSDIKTVGADAQAIAGWNGPGPFVIENNYLEASGEVFLLGGADPGVPDLVPAHVEVRFNHMTRPMTWKDTRWQVKNLLELKNARDVTIEDNLFENNWLAAQPGYAILFTPRNQDGKCPWCVVEHVVFAHNVVRNSSAGLSIAGFDSDNPSRQTNGIRVEDNLFYGITSKLGGNGWGVLIGDAPREVSFDRNTFDFDGTTLLYAYDGQQHTPRPIEAFRFTSNAAPHGQYGINGGDASTGTSTLARYFPGATVSGNWLSGGSSSKYPPGNRFDAPFDSGVHTVPKNESGPPKTGADVVRLLAMADAVSKGVMNVTSSAK